MIAAAFDLGPAIKLDFSAWDNPTVNHHRLSARPFNEGWNGLDFVEPDAEGEALCPTAFPTGSGETFH
jgi:hypothetical protein